MNRQDFINKIIKYSSRFVEEIKEYNALNLYNINMHSENFLIPVLNIIFDLNLENVNATRKKNFPSIDLADFKNRVAFQITSTSTADKIKGTLEKFFKNNSNKDFDVIYIYILTEKGKKYPEESIQQLIPDTFVFNTNEHIVDNETILQKTNSLSLEKLSYLSKIYEHEFSDIQIDSRVKKFQHGYLLNEEEDLYLNFLGIDIPNKFFIAELNIDEPEVLDKHNIWRNSMGLNPLKKFKNKENIVKCELKDKHIYCDNWLVRENKIFTFNDLNNRDEPLLRIVDFGTIESIDCSEYYSKSADNLRIFKSLLKYTFIQDCFYKSLEFVHQKGLIRFKIDNLGQENKTNQRKRSKKSQKSILWKNKKKSFKTVIFKVENKNDGHLICYRHLAFRPSFECFGDKWFLIINPDWSFTDPKGKKTSRFEKDYLSGIKRIENNVNIYYYYMFICKFLLNDDLFSNQKQILKFNKTIPLKFFPKLVDSKWLPVKEKLKNVEVNNSIIKNEFELNEQLFL